MLRHGDLLGKSVFLDILAVYLALLLTFSLQMRCLSLNWKPRGSFAQHEKPHAKGIMEKGPNRMWSPYTAIREAGVEIWRMFKNL